jgi:phage anti-repressor protein
MYAAYERLVQQEINGELTESFTIIKDNGKSKQMRTFFIVNEDKAVKARLRAYKRALEETTLAQSYAARIAEFVREGFKAE